MVKDLRTMSLIHVSGMLFVCLERDVREEEVKCKSVGSSTVKLAFRGSHLFHCEHVWYHHQRADLNSRNECLIVVVFPILRAASCTAR